MDQASSALYSVDLTTPLRANMKDGRPPWLIRQAMRLRRGIETAFRRLVEDFGVLRNKGRDFWRWSARFLRKVLAYNLSLRFERTFAREWPLSYAGNPRFGKYSNFRRSNSAACERSTWSKRQKITTRSGAWPCRGAWRVAGMLPNTAGHRHGPWTEAASGT